MSGSGGAGAAATGRADCTALVVALASGIDALLEGGNGFLGMVLLALSLLDRGEAALPKCCGTVRSASSGESRWM